MAIEPIVRRIEWHRRSDDASELIGREWLVTNGLGGYSSGTLGGIVTRRYHGILVAALPNPLGRMVMLNQLDEWVALPDGTTIQLAGEDRTDGAPRVPAARYLEEFRLEDGLPVWRFAVGTAVVERRVLMPYHQNTVHVSYALVRGDEPLRLALRPAVHFRPYETAVNAPLQERYQLRASEGSYLLEADAPGCPPLRIRLSGPGCNFTVDERRITEIVYPVEESRGYEFRGTLWTPGRFALTLRPNEPVALIASTEADDVMTALTPLEARRLEQERRHERVAAAAPAAQQGVGAELVLAADQFVIAPAGRLADRVRARARDDELRTVIAGYHWFTDWGRDTMISLEGLTLVTGRHREAAAILRAFGHYVRDGLIPNMFPDGSDLGLYHTADATLWFFHAVHRYLRVTGDVRLRERLLPTLLAIVDHHVRGTHFGIGMDPADGLLRQGAEGYQLTWMDAKVDGWVVTPRRGKAVEINALWYNALCLLERWIRDTSGDAESASIAALAERVRRSFNERFWYGEGGYLYDVVDGPEGASAELRPNQVLAIALEHPVLESDRWPRVLDVCRRTLLTPVGLRSLAPGSEHYHERYFGDLHARDAAYHQGTVWGWLIGPWIDAWRRVYPEDRAGARAFLDGLIHHLDDFGVGSVAEIFDAEPPYAPRGCIAQAWSVAEVLRCYVETAEVPGVNRSASQADTRSPEPAPA